jgi:hypothetical protein
MVADASGRLARPPASAAMAVRLPASPSPISITIATPM